MKKFIAILVCAVMLFGLVACNEDGTIDEQKVSEVITQAQAAAASAEGSSSAKAELDRDAVAVKVGDREITAGEIQDSYEQYVEMYEYYGYSAPDNDADIETLQDQIVDGLVADEIKLYKAQELGCDQLSEEQLKELDETVAEEEAQLIGYYAEEAADGATEDEIRETAIQNINAELEASGWGMDFAGYMEYVRDYYKKSYILDNLEKKVKDGATVSDDDAKAKYNELIESQKAAVAEDPSSYFSNEYDYEVNASDVPMIVSPEGYARIKVLSVFPQEALSSDYDSLANEMTSLEAEYGKLVLSGSEDKARIAEIEKDYASKKAESDSLMKEHITQAKAKIEEAYAKLQAGADFDTVSAAYNEDVSVENYPVVKQKGWLLWKDGDDGMWDEAIRNAAKQLKAGEYSGVIQIDDEFHIVYMVGDEEAKEMTYDEASELIKMYALAEAQNTLWEETQEEWEQDKSIITLYEDAYRMIGK